MGGPSRPEEHTEGTVRTIRTVRTVQTIRTVQAVQTVQTVMDRMYGPYAPYRPYGPHRPCRPYRLWNPALLKNGCRLPPAKRAHVGGGMLWPLLEPMQHSIWWELVCQLQCGCTIWAPAAAPACSEQCMANKHMYNTEFIRCSSPSENMHSGHDNAQ